MSSFEKHTLLVDGNALGYTWQQATKLSSGGMATQAAYGMLNDMRTLRKGYPLFTPLILWDGRAQWRFDLHPDYKSNRRSTPEKIAMKASYAEQKPYIQALLRHLGIRQITHYDMEADDLAGHFVGKLSGDATHRIGLFTGDRDWLQLVRRNVFWRDLRDDSRIVTASTFYEKTGCKTPYEFLERKCLEGDISDCIPGVWKVGPKTAADIIAQFGSVREYWRQVDAGIYVPKKVAYKNLADPTGRAIMGRNIRMMQLLKVEMLDPARLHIDKGRFDKDAFASVCEELAFASILKNLDEYTSLFEPRIPA